MTPDDLVDMELIKRTKYAYLRCLDQKDWAGLAEVLCEDATASYSGGKYTYTGRDEIVGFISRNMGREAFHSSHRVHHPEIELDGDVATATWALEDTVLDTDWNFLLAGAALTRTCTDATTAGGGSSTRATDAASSTWSPPPPWRASRSPPAGGPRADRAPCRSPEPLGGTI